MENKRNNESPSFLLIGLIIFISFIIIGSINKFQQVKTIFLILVGEYIFLMGINSILIELIRKKNGEEKFNSSVIILTLIGIIFMFISFMRLSNSIDEIESILFLVAFIIFIISMTFTILSYKEKRREKKTSFLIKAICIENKETKTMRETAENIAEHPLMGSGNVTVYSPVYSFSYQGKEWQVCNELYTNTKLEVGKIYDIFIDPKNPNNFKTTNSSRVYSYMFIFSLLLLIGSIFMFTRLF